MAKTIRVNEYETDNRDLGETVIVLKDGTRIDVSPWDLVRNALENLEDGPTTKAMSKVLDHLHSYLADMDDAEDDDVRHNTSPMERYRDIITYLTHAE